MRALLLSKYKTLPVVERPTPEIGDDDMLVRVRACGICGQTLLVDGGMSTAQLERCRGRDGPLRYHVTFTNETLLRGKSNVSVSRPSRPIAASRFGLSACSSLAFSS